MQSSPEDDPYDHRFEFESPPQYNSDSENESIERHKELIACEVANFLLEQNRKTTGPSSAAGSKRESKFAQPHPTPAPVKPIKRRLSKPLRRPKHEPSDKLCNPVLRSPKTEKENCPPTPRTSTQEKTLANGYWLAPHELPRNHPSSCIDPSWGNHSVASKPNTWESVYDSWYTHPTPPAQVFRDTKPRNSVETSTEDSSVFSDAHRNNTQNINAQAHYPHHSADNSFRDISNSSSPLPPSINNPWVIPHRAEQFIHTPDSGCVPARILNRPRRPLSEQSSAYVNRRRWQRTRDGIWLFPEQYADQIPNLSRHRINPREQCQTSSNFDFAYQTYVKSIEARLDSVVKQVEEIRRDLCMLQKQPPSTQSAIPMYHSAAQGW